MTAQRDALMCYFKDCILFERETCGRTYFSERDASSSYDRPRLDGLAYGFPRLRLAFLWTCWSKLMLRTTWSTINIATHMLLRYPSTSISSTCCWQRTSNALAMYSLYSSARAGANYSYSPYMQIRRKNSTSVEESSGFTALDAWSFFKAVFAYRSTMWIPNFLIWHHQRSQVSLPRTCLRPANSICIAEVHRPPYITSSIEACHALHVRLSDNPWQDRPFAMGVWKTWWRRKGKRRKAAETSWSIALWKCYRGGVEMVWRCSFRFW